MKFRNVIASKQIFLLFFLTSQIFSNPLVESDWLSKNLCKEKVKVIEVGKSFNSYKVEHLNCASYTNFYNDGWRISEKGVHMVLPDVDNIKKIFDKLGINNNDHIVLYPKKNDKYAMSEVTAIYFTFKYLGHKNISILNGGYPKFKSDFPLLTEEGKLGKNKKTNYEFKINNSILAKAKDLKNNISQGKRIIDSREVDFYLGINKINGFSDFGTIESSINIPSMWNLKSRGLSFNSVEILRKIHQKVSKNENLKDDIYFCYAGLESSLNWFIAHEILKKKDVKLYEGSIYDWKRKNNKLFRNY